MSYYPPEFYDTEGPLGIPMKDHQASQLEAVLAKHPEAEYQRAVVEKATSEITEGERADVSWISTETVDRDKEIVVAAGMDDSHYQHNPIVTLGHSYYMPPIGRSLWRRKMKASGTRGIKAKTLYPARPADWTKEHWEPDTAYALVKSGLMVGKSIGFISLESGQPSPEEITKNPELATVRRIIRKWLLLEYACTWMPCNHEALITEVGKSQATASDAMLHTLSIDRKQLQRQPPPQRPTTIIPLDPYIKRMEQYLKEVDLKNMAAQSIQNALDKLRGRV